MSLDKEAEPNLHMRYAPTMYVKYVLLPKT